MKRLKAVVAVTALALALSGCARWHSHSMSYANEKAQSGGAQRVFLWRSDYSAGMGTREGICAQAATTMRASSAEASAKINDTLSSAVSKKKSPQEAQEAARAMIAFNNNTALTNATSVQTAYANISLFYLCQVALNQRLRGDAIKTLWDKAHDTAAQLSKDAVNVAQLFASPLGKPDEGEAADGNDTAGPIDTPAADNAAAADNAQQADNTQADGG